MLHPEDPFSGTWKLNPAKSNFDPNHRPIEGTLHFERDAQGCYHMRAEGAKELLRNNVVIFVAESRSSTRHEKHAAGGGSRPFPSLELSLLPDT